MNNNLSPFLKRLQEEPQSLLPIGYVALVLIGMIHIVPTSVAVKQIILEKK